MIATFIGSFVVVAAAVGALGIGLAVGRKGPVGSCGGCVKGCTCANTGHYDKKLAVGPRPTRDEG